ncbi:MAG: HEAT repeat domain-containing protein [Nitrospirales bacterium]
MMKNCPLILLSLVLIVLTAASGEARRTHLTPAQQEQLKKVQSVYIHILALTEKGPYDTPGFSKIITSRIEDLGYTVVLDRAQAHDVQLKVKCEERKTWAGTTAAGGDAELADAPLRLWKGPACLFSYHLGNRDLGWYKEIRTTFEDTRQAAQDAQVKNPGTYAMTQLQERLKEYDFPVLLTAEWGQIDRLLSLLEKPHTHKLRKLKILSVLSELNAQQALPQLTEFLQDKDLQQEAITALTGVGQDSIPLLIDLFQHSTQPAIQAGAAKALGTIAAASGDPRTIPPLVAYLTPVVANMKTSEDINFPVITEVIWAIGKLRDDQSIEPMKEFQEKIWLIYDNSQAMTDLREATNWAYKQLDLDGHIS